MILKNLYSNDFLLILLKIKTTTILAVMLTAFSCTTIPHKNTSAIDIQPVKNAVKSSPELNSSQQGRALSGWIQDKLNECESNIKGKSEYQKDLENKLQKKDEEISINKKRIEEYAELAGKYETLRNIAIIAGLSAIGMFLWKIIPMVLEKIPTIPKIPFG
ncbi:MAG: hypothetical protein L6Q54_10985 [Leptospiraceae bacterium]|nr:hypothetical protein [Leptospiraceae bacterium]MCK6381752.1 hypothetical protein [Leptospiraceae bacterium]